MSATQTHLGTKSWFAYVKVLSVTLLVCMLTLPFLSLFVPWLAAGLGLCALIYVIHQMLYYHSHRLYMDAEGVWVCRGYLPWNKGVSGVKWRDLDEAVYFSNMLSWLCKSYLIRVSHRYSKYTEIRLAHMAAGHKAVSRINDYHQSLIDQGILR